MSTLKEVLKDIRFECKALWEVANFSNGKGHEKVISVNGKFIVVNSKFVSTEGRVIKLSNEQLSPVFKNDILIVMSDLPNGRALAKTFLVDNNNKYTLNQRIGKISIKDKNQLDAKFLNYILNRSSQFLKFDNGVDQTNLKKADIENVLIPIPYPNAAEKSLEVQKEIVRVLDGLSEQNKALITALRAEIDSRKRQYIYYREQLFKFEGKEVKWKSFGELGEIIRGNGLQKSDFTETGVGCIHYGQIYTYYGTSATKTKSFVSSELAKKLKKVNKSDLIITNTSENIADVCKAVAWLGEEEIVTGGHACILKHNQNPKFLVYYTQTNEFFKEKKKLAKGTKVMDVSAKELSKIKLPVPSIEEQGRIVNVLDEYDFANQSIIKELNSEIDLRNKQYEYYRNLLLTFPKENE